MQKDADSWAGGWALAVLLAVSGMTWMVRAVSVVFSPPFPQRCSVHFELPLNALLLPAVGLVFNSSFNILFEGVCQPGPGFTDVQIWSCFAKTKCYLLH